MNNMKIDKKKRKKISRYLKKHFYLIVSINIFKILALQKNQVQDYKELKRKVKTILKINFIVNNNGGFC